MRDWKELDESELYLDFQNIVRANDKHRTHRQTRALRSFELYNFEAMWKDFNKILEDPTKLDTMQIIRDKVQNKEEDITKFSDFEKLDELEKLAKFVHEYKDLDGFQPTHLEKAQEDFG